MDKKHTILAPLTNSKVVYDAYVIF